VRVAGAVAVVTGASSGIGRATAVELHARGAAHVVCVARREDRLGELVESLGGAAGRASYAVCDVADAAAVSAAAARVLDEHGRIDLLVNDAGMPLHRAFLDCTVAELERVMRVNYLGVVHWMKAVLPAMTAARRGAVVNVASTAGASPWTWEAGYSASKAAVIALTEAVAPELARAGVHCGWVNPGLVRTDIFSEEALRHVPRSVQRSFLEPAQVARAIVAAAEKERAGVSVPRLMGVPPLVRQLLPRLYRGGLRRTYEGTLRRDEQARG
jgi:3-oxoacyl-[acyl-carrier protein] reductase